MKPPGKISALCLLMVIAGAAQSMPVTYSFDVDFTGGPGPLLGQTERVFVTLDGVTGSGSETFTRSSGGLLAFDATLDGVHFTIEDATDDPLTLLIGLDNGALTQVNYYSDYVGGTHAFILSMGEFDIYQFNSASFEIEYILWNSGQINASSWRELAAVPTPGSLALLAVGLLGFGRLRAR